MTGMTATARNAYATNVKISLPLTRMRESFGRKILT